MVFKDYYKVLGLNSNKVSEEDIKIAYRDKAKQYHPDINVGNNSAEERFKEVNEAYRILSNEKTRRRYDFNWIRYAKYKKNQDGMSQSRTIKDMALDILFGTNNADTGEVKMVNTSKAYNGEDINTSIDISLKEGFFGVKKELIMKNLEGQDSVVTVKIPAGIQDGQTLRLSGKGEPGLNGGENGDIYIDIRVKESRIFTRNGNNVECTIPITVTQATLGAELKIPTVTGEEETFTISEGTQTGTKFTIKGKGFKRLNLNTSGDLIFTVQVQTPKRLTKEQRELFNKLAQTMNEQPPVKKRGLFG